MKFFVFGAGGVIGQHLMLCVPPGIDAHFFRKTPGPLFRSIDITDTDAVEVLLNSESPDVVLNLAGESNVESAENDPIGTQAVNAGAPPFIAEACRSIGTLYIHMSSQAVFDGYAPPYSPTSQCLPINWYGRNKLAAECRIWNKEYATIVRGTFCLGIRPIPSVGRENPAEAMLAGKQPRQVADRWFSVMFAEDAAESLWRIVQERPKGKIIHLGNPERKSRYDVAKDLGCDVQPCSHDNFPGLAPRAIDTTYGDTRYGLTYAVGIQNLKRDFESMRMIGFYQRARELALFFKIPLAEAEERLGLGFGVLHNEVTEDFNDAILSAPDGTGIRKGRPPQNDEELLRWYRETEAYCWELSAYHCDPGFNYSGMCDGIAENLGNHTAHSVLCLGDGIGDLTMSLRKRGFNAVYHDLHGSVTWKFAQHRFWMYGVEGISQRSETFEPVLPEPSGGYDAIVSLDYLEHLPRVEDWLRAIYAALRPGGVFCGQHAFGIGSGPEGSIPQHLACNDRFEKDYDPLMAEIGFVQIQSNWYRRP